MSLTSTINQPEIRQFLRDHVRPPKLSLHHPVALVPRRTTNPGRMGTAYDYAVRFGLQARGWAEHSGLVADYAADIGDEHRCFRDRALDEMADWPSAGPPSRHNASGCLRLAMLDLFFRAPSHAEMIEPSVADCDELIDLCALIPWTALRPHRTCFLNPTFGMGSRAVGGADADLIIDDTLVDFKVLAKPMVKARDYRQAICYALMANRYGANGEDVAISNIGILQGRTGELVTWPLSESVSPAEHDLVLDTVLNANGGLQRLSQADVSA